MDKSELRQLAERIIENLEQMSLPKTAHAERESMIGDVHGALVTSLSQIVANSPAYSVKQIQNWSGFPPKDYVAERFIEKSDVLATLLHVQDETRSEIAEICRNCGCQEIR